MIKKNILISGATPIFNAFWHEDINLIDKLLDHGADPYATKYNGDNLAFQVEDPKIVRRISFLINRYNCYGK